MEGTSAIEGRIGRQTKSLENTYHEKRTLDAMEAFSILAEKVHQVKKKLDPRTLVSLIEDESGFNLYLVGWDEVLFEIAGDMEYEKDISVYVLTPNQYDALLAGGRGNYEVTDIEVGELEEG